jgi:hypothetical protein
MTGHKRHGIFVNIMKVLCFHIAALLCVTVATLADPEARMRTLHESVMHIKSSPLHVYHAGTHRQRASTQGQVVRQLIQYKKHREDVMKHAIALKRPGQYNSIRSMERNAGATRVYDEQHKRSFVSDVIGKLFPPSVHEPPAPQPLTSTPTPSNSLTPEVLYGDQKDEKKSAQENDTDTDEEELIDDDTNDETPDETADETTDETADETTDETADETTDEKEEGDENTDETTDETADEKEEENETTNETADDSETTDEKEEGDETTDEKEEGDETTDEKEEEDETTDEKEEGDETTDEKEEDDSNEDAEDTPDVTTKPGKAKPGKTSH